MCLPALLPCFLQELHPFRKLKVRHVFRKKKYGKYLGQRHIGEFRDLVLPCRWIFEIRTTAKGFFNCISSGGASACSDGGGCFGGVEPKGGNQFGGDGGGGGGGGLRAAALQSFQRSHWFHQHLLLLLLQGHHVQVLD